MEGGKQTASSFTSDLFGTKKSSSSSQVLSSIFSPPSKVGSLNLSEKEKKNGSVAQSSTAEASFLGDEQKGSTYFQEPFHYSSSLYYGAQDVYFQPQSALNPGPTTFSKDDSGEDDSGSASRGNWWQGSLYY